ncbi:MAG: NADH-quinone oxidoreductase subunit C [Nitrososphaerota archaeon]|nr:NADH-quinone oxidoreductase subunit C [Nitrososphaerota archaeon]
MDKIKVDSIAAKIGATIANNQNSTTLTVDPAMVKEACRMIVSEMPEMYHLTTITGVDEGSTIEVYYHFWEGKQFLSVKTSVNKETPVIDSVSDFLPSSLLYEAEVKDLLGVLFKGNPMMDRRLLLPDNYPVEAPPPLRKEADPEKIRKMMELE